MANFLFPEDQKKTKGAVRLTVDETNFYVPTVLHSLDGVTPISETNPLPVASLVIVKSDPSFSGSGNVTHTFTKSMFAFAINNKGTSLLTFTIDGSTVTVGAGEAFSENFEPFTEVSIVASGAWEAYGLTYPVISVVVTPAPPPDVTPPNDATNLVVTNLAATSLTLGWTASTSSDIALYDVYKGSTLLGTVAGLTCNVTGLTASTAYTFTVKAKDASNNVSAGVSVNTTTSAPSSDTTAPVNVTNLTTASVTQTTLTLNWTASTDNVAVTGYDVFNGSTFLATVTGTTYNVTGLTASTAYTFTVKARDAAGNLATGTSVGVTTSAPADTTAPVLTITPAAGTYTSTQTVSMSATDNSGATPTIYYTLDGSTPTTSSSVYSSTLSVSATTTVKAFARDGSGNNSAVQAVTYTINLADTTPPNPVTALSAGTPTSNSVPLTWTLSSSGDVATQEVAYSTDGTNFTVASAVVNAASNTYTVTGLTASTAYTFRVVAVDGAGNRSTAVTTTATTAAALSAIVSDTFTRADSATTLGTSDTGQAWQAIVGTWGITSNQAYLTNPGSEAHAVIDSGVSDCSVQVTFSTKGNIPRIIFRHTNSSNYWLIDQNYKLYKRVNNTFNPITTTPSTFTASNGDTVKFTLLGSSISFYLNGVLQYTVTDTFNQTATNHGIGSGNLGGDINNRFDNFQVLS